MLWVSVAAIFLVAASGLRFWSVENPVRLHVGFALAGTLLGLFAHTMTMFYFIGTGKKIKDFIAEWDEQVRNDLRAKIIVMKRKLFPWMTLICGLLMAAFIMGGAADAQLVSKGTHAIIAYVALIGHVHVSAMESIYIFRNLDLIHEVNDRARKRTPPPVAKQG